MLADLSVLRIAHPNQNSIISNREKTLPPRDRPVALLGILAQHYPLCEKEFNPAIA